MTSRRSLFKPTIEALEDRNVPSGMADMTTVGAEAVINDALFRQTDTQPTGTGVIQSFVRLQSNKGNLEQGYNTDARPLEFDEKTSAQFTRSIRLADAGETVIDGSNYREFLLDINQKSSQPYLSLDELRLYVADVPDLSGYDANTKELGGQTAVYDLDAGGDSWIKLDYRLNSGSGSGDLLVYIPSELFGNAADNPFVYLYSKFGEHFGANSGFEEWATRELPPVPPPGEDPASLSGLVFVDDNQNGVFDGGEAGIANVLITLHGSDSQGNKVLLSTVTGPDGTYSFTNVPPGTYTLQEVQPDGFDDGGDTVGTVNGEVRGTLLEGFDLVEFIVLGSGESGINYNFGELLTGGGSPPV